MKVEIDSEELKRLKSREEKYLAYMNMLSYRWEDKTEVDTLCWKVAELEEENKKLKERINTMQEFIDYSEWVVQNAIWMLYEEWWEDKALDYLENCYATGDDEQYEEMERLYKNED